MLDCESGQETAKEDFGPPAECNRQSSHTPLANPALLATARDSFQVPEVERTLRNDGKLCRALNSGGSA